MNNYTFLITSAINTKFGVYSSDQRLQQTIGTIESIRKAVPTAEIILIEMAAIPLFDKQRSILNSSVDKVIDFTGDHTVQDLYHSTDNWDVVKNVTEVTCFGRALRVLKEHFDQNQVKRCFKISGRYTLTDNFDINIYAQNNISDMITVSRARPSQFSQQVTGGITQQFMSRLWSWPSSFTDKIISVYDSSLEYMFSRLSVGGYADIEHTLYHFLDHNKLVQLDKIGITGNIGPNGAKVED